MFVCVIVHVFVRVHHSVYLCDVCVVSVVWCVCCVVSVFVVSSVFVVCSVFAVWCVGQCIVLCLYFHPCEDYHLTTHQQSEDLKPL